jgi:hypothetical protein
MLGFCSISEFAISELSGIQTALILDFTGGMVVGGNQPILFGRIQDYSGGVVVGGGNNLLHGQIQEVSGGVVAGGAYLFLFGSILNADGGVVAGGNVLFVIGKIVGFFGGVVIGGDNPLGNMTPIKQLYVSGKVASAGTDFNLSSPNSMADLLMSTCEYELSAPKVIFILNPATGRFVKL